ncbi:MAG TPA: MlaD family protein [Pseudonocardiaceae bacterium]|nr:MlaD family protein [Pseudonocardiaceae bacterium]
MLTRFIRIQLVIFTVAGTVGVLAMLFLYMQVPTLLGIGRITVTMELPVAGGLYRFGNVTYRGVEIGKVTSVALTGDGVKATLSLNTAPKVPADLVAEVRSISAVGEQYVELRPRTDSPPYLHDGSVIAMRDTTIPQDVGPVLDQANALIASIPKDQLNALLQESFKGFNGAGYDLGSLADSAATLGADLNPVADNARALYTDTAPLLDSQAQTADSIKLWSRSLAGVTEQLVANDPELRRLLHDGPGAFDEASALLEQIKPTLPVLLANLTTIGTIGVTYHASLEQLLVLLPPSVASTASYGSLGNSTGLPLGDFTLGLGDPPACTVGFLPPSMWRSPSDTTTIDTPDGLYCKLPQDSPISVRGARNTPCMGVPGKRAPTVQICESDQPYQPLAMRQHALGPYPLDPNLVGQGVPLDDRVTFGDNIFAPVQGTPLPPGVGAPPAVTAPAPAAPEAPPAGTVAPAAAPAAPPDEAPHLPPAEGPPPGPAPEAPAPQAMPSRPGTDSSAAPSAATVQYNPRTGRYVAPDGRQYQQLDLMTATAPKTWQDLLPK